jgi:hypothetical protein
VPEVPAISVVLKPSPQALLPELGQINAHVGWFVELVHPSTIVAEAAY